MTRDEETENQKWLHAYALDEVEKRPGSFLCVVMFDPDSNTMTYFCSEENARRLESMWEAERRGEIVTKRSTKIAPKRPRFLLPKE